MKGSGSRLSSLPTWIAVQVEATLQTLQMDLMVVPVGDNGPVVAEMQNAMLGLHGTKLMMNPIVFSNRN